MASELATSNGRHIELSYEGRAVRFVGTAERPEWVAADVGDLLGIKNVRQVLAGLDDDEKGVCTVYTLGGSQPMATVYEPGLYGLINKSRKPQAKKFQRWVCHEVLPSIRKHGTYPPPAQVAPPPASGDSLLDSIRNLEVVVRSIGDVRERQLQLEREQAQNQQRMAAVEQSVEIAARTATAALHQSTSNHGYFTVLGYSRLRKREMPVTKASAHGRKLSAMCAQRGITPERMTDPRFGEVNSYPESLLREYFNDPA